jgi:hypothetical protein
MTLERIRIGALEIPGLEVELTPAGLGALRLHGEPLTDYEVRIVLRQGHAPGARLQAVIPARPRVGELHLSPERFAALLAS